MRDLELEFEHESAFESEFESELEQEMESEGEFEGVHEHEHEHEFESGFHEGEHELNPTRRVYLDAMLEMEHFAAMAAESESEQEAEQFFPLLLPLAAKALPFIAKAGAKFLPKLIGKVIPKAGKMLMRYRNPINRGIRSIGRSFIRRGNPKLNRALPTIVRRAAGQIQNQVAAGRVPTPQQAQRILYNQARRVINNPTVLSRAMRNSQAADQLYHRRIQGISTGNAMPMRGRGPRRWRSRGSGCGCRRCSCGCGCGC